MGESSELMFKQEDAPDTKEDKNKSEEVDYFILIIYIQARYIKRPNLSINFYFIFVEGIGKLSR